MNETKKKKKMTKRMRQKEKTREVYILAAIEVFRELGFSKAQVKDITARAGTSVGNFYHYYDNKEQIIGLIFEQIASIFTKLIANLQQYDLPTYKNFHDMFRNYLRIVKNRPNLILFFIEQMGGVNQEFLDKKNELVDNAAKEAEKLLTKLMERKFIPKQDPKLSAYIWINTLMTTYQWWAHSNFEAPEEDVIRNMTNFLIWGTTAKKIVPKKK